MKSKVQLLGTASQQKLPRWTGDIPPTYRHNQWSWGQYRRSKVAAKSYISCRKQVRFLLFFSTVLRNTHSHLHQKSHRGLLINEPTSLSHSHSQNNLGFNPSSLGAVFGNRWAQNTFKLCQHHIREGFCWGCIEKPVLKGLLKVISSLVLSILALKLLCLRQPHRKYRNRL